MVSWTVLRPSAPQGGANENSPGDGADCVTYVQTGQVTTEKAVPSEAVSRGERVNLIPGNRVRVIGARGAAKIHVILTNMHRSLLENEIDPLRRQRGDRVEFSVLSGIALTPLCVAGRRLLIMLKER